MLKLNLSPEKQAELNEQLFDAIVKAEDEKNFINGKRNELFNYPLSDDNLTKVEALLKAGADPDYISDNFTLVYKCTFIERAASCPDEKLYQLLLKYGATLFRDSAVNRIMLFKAIHRNGVNKISIDILHKCKGKASLEEREEVLKHASEEKELGQWGYDFYAKYKINEEQKKQKKQKRDQKHKKSLQIQQIIDNILNRKVEYRQFIREHRTALLSTVLLTLGGAYLFGLAPLTMGILGLLSFAGTLGFQLQRDKIANNTFKDLMDKSIITINPSLKNKGNFLKSHFDNSDNSKKYLSNGFNAEKSWKGYFTCTWTLPGSKNNSLVQAGRKAFELISKIRTEVARNDETNTAGNKPKVK